MHDVHTILKSRKLLPKGVYISEDLPEEWNDRRHILKPIFNAAKRDNALKTKTFLSRDRLVIDGNMFTVAPTTNILDAGKFVDIPGTCQWVDSDKTIFLGCHSVFSNLHPCCIVMDNIVDNCVEQKIQSDKAAMFNDDQTHAKIMHELNPYKIKKYGSKVCNFQSE